MFLYFAFLLGLLGSLHCLGMCGPIAVALPIPRQQARAIARSRLLYNIGRVFSYSLIGFVVGLLGKGLVFFSSQQWLSVGVGLIILGGLFIPKHQLMIWSHKLRIQGMSQKIKASWAFLFRQKTSSSYLMIGFLNGFLPCGLVYLAIAGALATGELWQATAYMFFFGLGTMPMMLGISWMGGKLRSSYRAWLYRRLVPVFAFTLGVLFIVRGLNLGIPMLSPELVQKGGQSQIECCETE